MSEYNIQMNKYNALNAGYDQLYPQPMKHANTHAKDGNDPITPSMIGTYNITKIDTLLQKKAPAGFGLGSQSKYISSSEDLNNIVYDGWYEFEAAPINAPLLDGVNAIGYSTMLVSNREPSLYVTQEIFCYTSWEVFNCVLRRCRINGEWKPWEWVNPPMMIGVEYRTTERYLGKPVYVRTVDFGDVPNATTKRVGAFPKYQIVDHIVGYTAEMVTSEDRWSLPVIEGKSIAQAYCSLTLDGLSIITTDDYYSKNSATAKFTVKYTKTTD